MKGRELALRRQADVHRGTAEWALDQVRGTGLAVGHDPAMRKTACPGLDPGPMQPSPFAETFASGRHAPA